MSFPPPGYAYIALYVDDAVLYSRSNGVIDEVLSIMQRHGLDLTREGNLSSYLGIQIKKIPDGHLRLSQPGLIRRVIDALGLDDSNPKTTPAEAILGRDLNGPGDIGAINYHSVVGMLMYLGNNTPIDCTFAINQ
jgi:hypothetical protein